MELTAVAREREITPKRKMLYVVSLACTGDVVNSESRSVSESYQLLPAKRLTEQYARPGEFSYKTVIGWSFAGHSDAIEVAAAEFDRWMSEDPGGFVCPFDPTDILVRLHWEDCKKATNSPPSPS